MATPDTSLRLLLGDDLGSTAVTADSSGVRTGELRYAAWGETRYEYQTTPTKRRYTGQAEEPNIGLCLMGARWYDSSAARWVSPDVLVPSPSEPQTLNHYSYVSNCPMQHIDPSGSAQEEGAGSTYDHAYWLDLLLWLVREANRDASIWETRHLNSLNTGLVPESDPLSSKVEAYGMFTEIVKDSAPWDFKDQIKNDLGDPIRIGGKWFEYSTPGNILYGFYGCAAGFTPLELHIGAGYAQLQDQRNEGAEIGGLPTLFDSPDDYYAIEFGVELYNQTLAQGKPVTVGAFSALLTNYGRLNDMAVRQARDPDRPQAEGWPYQPGRFNGKAAPQPPDLFPSFR